MSENITPHEGDVEPEEKERITRQRGYVLWMTGLSGSGKSTVAFELEKQLVKMGHLSSVLDGDNLRKGLNRDLGFSAADRAEGLRRTAEAAKLLAEAGVIVVASTISPAARDRECARELIGEDRFAEIWVATPLEVCEERDPKGLYAKARRGEIEDFTGVSAPYEEPESPDLEIHPEREPLHRTTEQLLRFLSSVDVISH